MTDKLRLQFALRYQTLLHSKLTRKEAMLQLREEIYDVNPAYPRSRTQIYVWCRKFDISIS